VDNFLLDFELLKQLEEEALGSTKNDEKEENVCPYQNAHQETVGQLACMFHDIDEILMSIELEEENSESIEDVK